MSADNWTICPRCKRNMAIAQERLQEQVAEAYGKVPAQEYLAMRDKFIHPEPLKETLREDWFIGLDGEEFSVHYTCSCEVCHFSFKHDYSIIVDLEKPWKQTS